MVKMLSDERVLNSKDHNSWRKLTGAPGFAMVIAAGLLGGCSQSNGLLQGPGLLAQGEPGAGTQQQGKGKSIAFAPIIGAPEAVSSQLKGSVVAAAEQKSVPVLKTASANPDFTVRGYIVASPDTAGTKVSYIWDVLDKTDKRVHRISGKEVAPGPKQSDPWANVKPAVIQGIAQKTATQLASWVPKDAPASAAGAAQGGANAAASVAAKPAQNATSAVAAAQRTTGAAAASAQRAAAASRSAQKAAQQTTQRTAKAPTAAAQRAAAAARQATRVAARPNDATSKAAIVPPVVGAPGDGNTSLAAALQRALGQQGIASGTAAPASAFTVKGNVKVGVPTAGRQSIQIVWTVVDKDGREVGTVTQSNSLPQGKLDGKWGPTADAAARSAVGKVVSLIKRKST